MTTETQMSMKEKSLWRVLATFSFEGVTIPEYMHGGLVRYFFYHIDPGSFLRAVLENDLMGAFGQADEENMHRMPAYAAFLYSTAPPGSYGSPEAVKAWLEELA